jgi:hypothetical protein
MRDGTDPVQDIVDRLARRARETAEDTVKARWAVRAELTVLSTRTGLTACHILTSHHGR